MPAPRQAQMRSIAQVGRMLCALSCWKSLFAEFFQFFRCLWPIFFEQQGERTIGKQPTTGLTFGTVVGLVIGIADALNFFAADWTGFSKFAVDSHFGSKGGDIFREGIARLVA